MKTEYKTKLVEQVIASRNGQLLICRYDYDTEMLYFQNRSKDKSLSTSDYLFMRAETIKQAEEKGFKLSITEVPVGSLWPREAV